MAPERSGEVPQSGFSDEAPQSEIAWLALGWQAAFVMGAISFVLGLIVAFQPTASLNVIAVLLGILLIASGIYHIVEAFDGGERGRVWRGIAGILLIVGGVILIRHLHLSVGLIGLVIGTIWIVQGLLTLFAGIAVGRGPARWLPVVFGVVSLIAGIVVVSTPVAAVTTLATLIGIWFVVMGVFEMLGALAARRVSRMAGAGPVSVPGQRPGEGTATDSVPGGSSAPGRKLQG
jgi:uncharacterized membrane protein HdeD (DUF308 family)